MPETEQEKKDRLNRELMEAAHHARHKKAKPIKAPGGHGFLARAEENVEVEPEALKKPSLKKDWDVIVLEYQKIYLKGPNARGALVFPTREAAIAFFQDQAKALRQFLATAFKNDKPTDFHLFSCGDGVLYSGTYENIRSKLEEDHNTKGLQLLNKLMPNYKPPSEVPEKNFEEKPRHKGGSKSR